MKQRHLSGIAIPAEVTDFGLILYIALPAVEVASAFDSAFIG